MDDKDFKAVGKSGEVSEQRSDELFYSTIPLVLHYEGGYVNDPQDRGGKTNMGITQRFLEKYRG